MKMKWVNGFAPLRVSPIASAAKVMDLPERSVVEATDEFSGSYERVIYWTDRQPYFGWIYAGWLEDYVETLPKDCIVIPDQTPDPRDAEQYFLLNGIKQFNICGEACASLILGVGIKEILENWKQKKPGIWASIFGTGKLRGTNYQELMTIFEIYAQTSYSLTQIMTDKVIARPRYTVTGLQSLLDLGDVIASVSIDNAGRLKPSGALHWVAPTALHPERTGYGTIEIFNPYPNRIEIYTWNEFIASAKAPAGVFIPSGAFQEYKFI